jgi:hypothetical protein
MGWQDIDIQRVKVYHPFVTKVTNVKLDTIFMSASSSSQLLVMAREQRDSSLMSLKLNLYLAYGPRPNINVKETFITRLEMSEELQDPAYQCFGDLTISNANACNAPYDVSGFRKAFPTTWDRPCFANTDCPFYQANKNYPNERGGCLAQGKCEMPIGVYRKSYRYYVDTSPYTPICYQCKDPKDPACCEKQKNTKEYPDLKSPDYAFDNDKDARIKAGLPYFVSVS